MAYFPETPPEHKPDGEQDGRRKQRRRFTGRELLLLACAGLLAVIGLIQLAAYGMDWLASRETSREMAELYNEPTAEATLPPPPVTVTAVPAETPSATPIPDPEPTRKPDAEEGLLPAVPYDPDSPYLIYTPRIARLRQKAPDAVGWLVMPDRDGETVVQRDNTYYLTHDAAGRSNRNGALFLDEGTDLSERPYGYLIYGHNMKTGAMFGSLKNYENLHYYHENPFLVFDSLYEDGEYVIFAVGTVSTLDRRVEYVDLFALAGRETEARGKALAGLKDASVFTCPVEVGAEDQVLLLVTCVDDDDDRRVVAARRIRPGETREELQELVRQSRRKIYK